MMLTTLLVHPGPWNDGSFRDDAPAWWPVFPITFGLFWLAVAAGAFFLLRGRLRNTDPRAGAEKVLADRYARGEIDEDDYMTRLAVLRTSS